MEREVDKLKQERKATKKHITIAELPEEEERFSRLNTIADPHFHGDKITGGGAVLPPEHKE